MKKKIKLFSPKINQKEISAARNTLESYNWASGAGNNLVKKFEEKFCSYIGSKECVAPLSFAFFICSFPKSIFPSQFEPISAIMFTFMKFLLNFIIYLPLFF